MDPWDHVECAMALMRLRPERAGPARLPWLRGHPARGRRPGRGLTLHGDGDRRHAAESHHAAYVAVGVWHEFLVTGDRGFTDAHVAGGARTHRAGCSTCRRPAARSLWERDAAGTPGEFALLSGCSSILHGLRCAIALAELAGEPQPDWELAAGRLGHVRRLPPGGVRGQEPVRDGLVLPGARRRDPRRRRDTRLADGWDTFVVPGLGVRCVSDQPWVTVAETSELVLALDACGLNAQARAVFATVQWLRHDDGSYWTGWQFANAAHFPAERSSWTAAAVILAADALTGFSHGAGIFRDIPAPAWTPSPADPAVCGCTPTSADAIAGP